MSFWNRRRGIDDATAAHGAQRAQLRRSLGWPHLVALGVGGIVGTGIYTLTGEAAALAGPAAMLSFLIAGAVCACAALAYAEMATMIPVAGSAYTYSYAVIGEGWAWIVGWSLILEYTLVCSVVAVGWGGYASGLIHQAQLPIPEALMHAPGAGGVIDLPAIFIALAVAALLMLGTRESARVNLVLVIVKIVALAGFVAFCAPAFDAAHFSPFMPHGFAAHEVDGVKMGVMAAASIIFFAFYGFDAISTASEEARNPGRDLTIGIVGSMLICVLIYMAVAASAIGAQPVASFAKSAEPLAQILRLLDHPKAAALIGGAAVVALPTVIMVFMYGQSRVFFAMARDGLLPQRLAAVSAKRGVPVAVTLLTGVIAATLAGFMPLSRIVALANAGTLCAFIATAASMMILRIREPQRQRRFRTPWWPLIGTVAIVGCLYLFSSLPAETLHFFLIWNALGLLIYLFWARHRSALAPS
ncbi:amino acid permease [Solimonas marina]|uniref:Amino acid permease n=1 Tax=Solimonas marina TaxID=2714601 RepID=A0A970B6U2_9GAMM|nr:amino acid permease [Solimonas marina]NKF23183.1 amino acid permease [Solimonas marina]